MLKLVLLSIVHCAALCAGQIFMKLALGKTGQFALTWKYIRSFLLCWEWAACGLAFALALYTWMYILKRYDFSQAYPITSLTFVFSILAAVAVFHETVPVNRWIGVAMITAGVVFIAYR